jgi:hypothetical protein
MAFQALTKSSSGPRQYHFDTSVLSEVSKEYRLRLVGVSDRAAIDDLRRDAYGHAEDFHLFDLTPVLWDSADGDAFVLAVERGGQIVATMRATLVTDQKTIVQHLDASWPSAVPFAGPVLVLERAATAPTFQRLGLNSLLRYCFIKMAQSAGVKLVAGTVYQGASRIRLMESIGYQFLPIEEDHDHWAVKTDSPRLISILDLDRDGERALVGLTQAFRRSRLLVKR